MSTGSRENNQNKVNTQLWDTLYIFKGVTCKAVKPQINLKVRRYLYKKRTIVSLFACLQGSNFRALDRVVMQLINNKDKGKPTIRNSNSKDSLAIGNLVNYMNISALCFYVLFFTFWLENTSILNKRKMLSIFNFHLQS